MSARRAAAASESGPQTAWWPTSVDSMAAHGLPKILPETFHGEVDYPTRSGYLITPVVAWAANSSALLRNPDEVASVHRIALTDVLRPDAFDFNAIAESERLLIRFRHLGDFIHAPTAALIYQFRELLAGRQTRVAELEQPVFAWK